MATTAIWPIKGRVDKIIRYACNPEKTTEDTHGKLNVLHVVDNVIEYAEDEMKTEKRAYVSCINCIEETASEQFMETKRLWHKTDGRVCFHGYQSFQEGEVTAAQAHEIGVKLAQELWGDRFEVVVTTHCNTKHYHNHFVINSVSYLDGKKFYNSPEDYRHMREVSDRLCHENQLSVISHPGSGGRHYSEITAQREGAPTFASLTRRDIDKAVAGALGEKDFVRILSEMGYGIRFHKQNGAYLKYPALIPPGGSRPVRLRRLGENYSLESIRQRIYENIRRDIPFPEAEQQIMQKCFQSSYRHSGEKQHGLKGLYFRYCYMLKIIVKQPASVKQVPVSLREDVVKLEKYMRESDYLATHNIDSVEDLRSRKNSAAANITERMYVRRELRNRLKRILRSGNPTEAEALKKEIASVSEEIKNLRKEVQICESVEERSCQVSRNMECVENQQLNGKEIQKNEPIR